MPRRLLFEGRFDACAADHVVGEVAVVAIFVEIVLCDGTGVANDVGDERPVRVFAAVLDGHRHAGQIARLLGDHACQVNRNVGGDTDGFETRAGVLVEVFDDLLTGDAE